MTTRPVLDPDMQIILDRLSGIPFRPLAELGPLEARQQDSELFDPLWNKGNPALQDVRNITLPGAGSDLSARLYDPGLSPHSPALLYLHGGGFVLGGLESHDTICRHLALAGNCIVISLAYHLAPEHKFPIPLDDCVAGLEGIIRAAKELGIDPARLAVAGDSAGANLAFGVLRAASHSHRPRCGVLIYGMFETEPKRPSHQLYGDGSYLLSDDDLAFFWQCYLRDEIDRLDPRACAALAKLDNLPPLFIGAAEIDPLRDESVALAARLKAAGNDVQFRLWPGLTHAAFQMISALPAMQAHVAEIGVFLRTHLSSVAD